MSKLKFIEGASVRNEDESMNEVVRQLTDTFMYKNEFYGQYYNE